MQLMFFHGLESGPFGRKYQWLVDAGYSVESPDFEGIFDLPERLSIATDAIEAAMGPLLLVGSSYGGLVAALAYQGLEESHAAKVQGYLLLAPALHRPEFPDPQIIPQRAMVIHGLQDEIVPIEASREFCVKHNVRLHEVEDEHALSQSKKCILDCLSILLGEGQDPLSDK